MIIENRALWLARSFASSRYNHRFIPIFASSSYKLINVIILKQLLNNPRGWEIVRKINISLRGQCNDIPASQKGVYIYFIILWLVFSSITCWGRKKNKKQDVNARANDANNHIDWLFLFLLKLWLDQRCFPLYRIDRSETTQINQWENWTRPNQNFDRIDCWVMCNFQNSSLTFM